MSWGAPLFFSLGALALPVAILYILKVKRRGVAVPYLRLWQELLVETRARSLFQKLRRLYSLLLQLLILASLVLALGQPGVDLSSVQKDSIVLLLDTSASMGAVENTDLGRTRFEQMIERARLIIDSRSFEDEMMLVAISDRVDVISSFSRNTVRLREALEAVVPTNRELDSEAVYSFYKEVTSDREHPMALFLSDGAAGEIEALSPDSVDVKLIRIGEATTNVGVTRFSARKNTSLGTDYVLAVFRNFGDQEVETRYELSVREPGLPSRTVKVMDVSLAPGEERIERWEFSLDAGATLVFSIETEGDCLSIDDHAWAIVQPTRLRKVVLVTPDLDIAEPFKIAFMSMAKVISEDTFVTTSKAYPSLSEEDRKADVTIILDTLPEELPRQGNLILLNTDVPESLPAEVYGLDETPMVWDWDREHVLNRYLNYRDLPLPPAKVLRLYGGHALVETFEGPLVAAFDLSDRRVVYVAFDMLAELFPFRLAFPMLLRNSIAWFEIEEGSLVDPSYGPGAIIQPRRRVSGSLAHALFTRDGVQQSQPLPIRDGRFYFAETEEPGAYVLQIGGVPYPTSVNLFSAEESAIDPLRPELEQDPLLAEGGMHLLNRDIWSLLALLGLALWSLEWFTYHRRLTE